MAPAWTGISLRRRPRWIPTYVATIGAVEGNIIAAIMTTHVTRKNANVPSALPGPMSIPDMRTSDTSHATAARASSTA